jgi:hypothetical protein
MAAPPAFPGARRFLFAVILMLSACTSTTAPDPGAEDGGPELPSPPDVTPPPDTASPPDTAASPGIVVLTLGEPEVVMRYRGQACEEEDLPDVQTRAFRRSDGRIVLISGNAPRNRAMVGGDFDSLERDCQPILESADSPDPETFANQEWVLATYREGAVVHALVHNEYHDPVAENCRPGDTSPANPCWYNAITYARSTDEGRTFRQEPAPGRVVAAPPDPWDARSDRGAPPPYGYFTPSNIVRGPDGAFYTVIFAIPRRDEQTNRGACVLRTTDLSDPSGWRAWDGTGWTLRLGSPYADGPGTPCTFVSRPEIQDLHGSLTYNTYLERYILVGVGARNVPGGVECGFYLSLSRDLVHWTPRRLIREAKQPFPHCSDGSPDGSEIYPSLIDHRDTSVNFEFTGRTAHLYFVRWNQGLDRDLLRQSVTFELR